MEVCNILYSADPEAYFHRISGVSNFALGTECVNTLLQAFSATKRGSIERLKIRGLFSAHVPLKRMNGLIVANDIDSTEDDEPQPAMVGDNGTVTVSTGCTMPADVKNGKMGLIVRTCQ